MNTADAHCGFVLKTGVDCIVHRSIIFTTSHFGVLKPAPYQHYSWGPPAEMLAPSLQQTTVGNPMSCIFFQKLTQTYFNNSLPVNVEGGCQRGSKALFCNSLRLCPGLKGQGPPTCCMHILYRQPPSSYLLVSGYIAPIASVILIWK